LDSKKLRVYLDSNVFIFGKERSNSNSRIILGLVEEGRIFPVISYLTLLELREYFTRKYGREAGINEIYYMISLPNLEIVSRNGVKKIISKYKCIVPEKDLPHLVSAIVAKVDYFITYSRHFIESAAKNYIKVINQASFVKLLGIEPKQTDY